MNNPIFDIDFYKVGHVWQYPPDTVQVWSNWTPRSTHVSGATGTIFFGLQYYLDVLIQKWREGFFSVPKDIVVKEYRRVIQSTLGVNPKTDHIEKLHDLGHLPIAIYALPEGSFCPLRVPSLVITNTHPCGFWLPNYLETDMSNILWKPSTSASTAALFRKIFTKYAKLAGEEDLSFVDWQGHDFSYRGMSGKEDAILSGMGHLLSFKGTDTIPAILAAEEHYDADIKEMRTGGSVPATEHSVMSAWGKTDELETFRHLIEDVYPSGPVSIVSDTWNLWTVLCDYIPKLKDKILARDGKLVIRPDSGDPVKILCGDIGAETGSPQFYGTLVLLESVLGSDRNRKGMPLINKAGAIYGDGINLDRAENILHQMVKDRLSPYNVVLGIGSYTYEYVTRDVYGFAMKATAVRRGEKLSNIWKDPITDPGGKKSHKGIPAVYLGDDGDYYAVQECTPDKLDACEFQKVLEDDNVLIRYSFSEIRKRLRERI